MTTVRYKSDENERGQADFTGTYIAKGLGVFSLVLGVTELALGGHISRALGLDGYAWLVRLYGAREFITGVFILACKDPTGWIWFRVAGDALDLATVGYGYMRNPARVVNIIIALVALVVVTIVDIYCAARLTRDTKEPLPPTKDYSTRTG